MPHVSKHWKKQEIIDLLKEGRSTVEIQQAFPTISSRTITKYRKELDKHIELDEIKLKVEYAKTVIPEDLQLEVYLKAKFDDFVRSTFPLLERLENKINERIEQGHISTKELIDYKFSLLNLLAKGSK